MTEDDKLARERLSPTPRYDEPLPIEALQKFGDRIPLDVLVYHAALVELERAAKAFALAITLAGEAAKKIVEDDGITMHCMSECRRALSLAFAAAPGFLQMLGKVT